MCVVTACLHGVAGILTKTFQQGKLLHALQRHGPAARHPPCWVPAALQLRRSSRAVGCSGEQCCRQQLCQATRVCQAAVRVCYAARRSCRYACLAGFLCAKAA